MAKETTTEFVEEKETFSLKGAVAAIGLPRLIISLFLILLFVLAIVYKMNVPELISDIISRFGLNAILVLAMVPGIQSGIGLNFGISIGVVGGLLGGLIAVELDTASWAMFAGSPALGAWSAFIIAIVLAIVFSSFFGFLYGHLLNRVKGSEMTVSTYVGFSVVAFMNIAWLALPFKNGEIIWPVGGEGLRNTVSVGNSFGEVVDKTLAFKLFGVKIPTGLILLIALACLLLFLFMRTKTGVAMSAAGGNPKFAQAVGINVNKMRITGTMLSTVIAAVGIVVYAESYGFLQLYNAPLYMGFACVAAVLIGGASVSQAKISHVIIGTFLFQGLLAVALPITNTIVPGGGISEIIRIIVSNGIILYALTKMKGGNGDE